MKKIIINVFLLFFLVINFNLFSETLIGGKFDLPSDITENIIIEYLKSEIQIFNKIANLKEIILPDELIDRLKNQISKNKITILKIKLKLNDSLKVFDKETQRRTFYKGSMPLYEDSKKKIPEGRSFQIGIGRETSNFNPDAPLSLFESNYNSTKIMLLRFNYHVSGSDKSIQVFFDYEFLKSELKRMGLIN